jgi:hypothetical protein
MQKPHIPSLGLPQYFESDQIPDRDAVARRLKSIGVGFDENTISINPRDEDDADVMRDGGIPVLKF